MASITKVSSSAWRLGEAVWIDGAGFGSSGRIRLRPAWSASYWDHSHYTLNSWSDNYIQITPTHPSIPCHVHMILEVWDYTYSNMLCSAYLNHEGDPTWANIRFAPFKGRGYSSGGSAGQPLGPYTPSTTGLYISGSGFGYSGYLSLSGGSAYLTTTAWTDTKITFKTGANVLGTMPFSVDSYDNGNGVASGYITIRPKIVQITSQDGYTWSYSYAMSSAVTVTPGAKFIMYFTPAVPKSGSVFTARIRSKSTGAICTCTMTAATYDSGTASYYSTVTVGSTGITDGELIITSSTTAYDGYIESQADYFLMNVDVPTPPNPPGGLTIRSISTNNVSLGWIKASDIAISGYKIYLYQSGSWYIDTGNWFVSDNGDGTVYASRSGLSAGTEYLFGVTATKNSLESSKSQVYATTPAAAIINSMTSPVLAGQSGVISGYNFAPVGSNPAPSIPGALTINSYTSTDINFTVNSTLDHNYSQNVYVLVNGSTSNYISFKAKVTPVLNSISVSSLSTAGGTIAFDMAKCNGHLKFYYRPSGETEILISETDTLDYPVILNVYISSGQLPAGTGSLYYTCDDISSNELPFSVSGAVSLVSLSLNKNILEAKTTESTSLSTFGAVASYSDGSTKDFAAMGAGLTWSSTVGSIANGTITFSQIGSGVLTASFTDGATVTAICNISVKTLEYVTVLPDYISMKNSQSINLDETIIITGHYSDGSTEPLIANSWSSIYSAAGAYDEQTRVFTANAADGYNGLCFNAHVSDAGQSFVADPVKLDVWMMAGLISSPITIWANCSSQVDLSSVVVRQHYKRGNYTSDGNPLEYSEIVSPNSWLPSYPMVTASDQAHGEVTVTFQYTDTSMVSGNTSTGQLFIESIPNIVDILFPEPHLGNFPGGTVDFRDIQDMSILLCYDDGSTEAVPLSRISWSENNPDYGTLAYPIFSISAQAVNSVYVNASADNGYGSTFIKAYDIIVKPLPKKLTIFPDTIIMTELEILNLEDISGQVEFSDGSITMVTFQELLWSGYSANKGNLASNSYFPARSLEYSDVLTAIYAPIGCQPVADDLLITVKPVPVDMLLEWDDIFGGAGAYIGRGYSDYNEKFDLSAVKCKLIKSDGSFEYTSDQLLWKYNGEAVADPANFQTDFSNSIVNELTAGYSGYSGAVSITKYFVILLNKPRFLDFEYPSGQNTGLPFFFTAKNFVPPDGDVYVYGNKVNYLGTTANNGIMMHTAIIPKEAASASQPVNVELKTLVGTSTPVEMVVELMEAPVLESIDPIQVGPGYEMFHRGQRFGITTGKVFIEDTELTVGEWHNEKTKSALPSGIPGGDCFTWIENENGVSNKLPVKVFGPIPRPLITNPTSHNGVYNETFTVYGKYFQKSGGNVEFHTASGRIQCKVQTWGMDKIEILIPSSEDTAGDIVVVTDGGGMSNAWPVRFDSRVPVITDPTPHRAVKGTEVTIHGRNLDIAVKVYFNDKELIFRDNNYSSLIAIMPNEAIDGYIRVEHGIMGVDVVTGQISFQVIAVSNLWFMRLSNKIEITDAQPNPAESGDVVYISGIGFGTSTGKVYLENKSGRTVCQIAGPWVNSITSIAIIPGMTSGDLYVENSFGELSNPWPLEIKLKESEKPVITSINPVETGLLPCALNIYGKNLIPPSAAFVGLTPLTITSSEQIHNDGLQLIKATVPDGTTSGRVSVVAPKGRAIGPVFQIMPPVIDYIIPSMVTERKPITVDVYGERLNSQFTFNGASVAASNVGDHYRFNLTVEQLKSGMVKCKGSNSVQLTVKFPKDPPVINSFSVPKGSFETTVAVIGMNFGATGQLLVNGSEVKTLSWTDTEITMYLDDYFMAGDVQVIRYDEE